jgi:hypothetical protein
LPDKWGEQLPYLLYGDAQLSVTSEITFNGSGIAMNTTTNEILFDFNQDDFFTIGSSTWLGVPFEGIYAYTKL